MNPVWGREELGSAGGEQPAVELGDEQERDSIRGTGRNWVWLEQGGEAQEARLVGSIFREQGFEIHVKEFGLHPKRHGAAWDDEPLSPLGLGGGGNPVVGCWVWVQFGGREKEQEELSVAVSS